MPFNSNVIVLVGSDLVTAVPYALPASAFQRMASQRAHNSTHLTGATCHAGVPQVLRTGPHGAGTADTDEYRVRAVFVPPVEWSAALVHAHPTG